MGSIFTPGELLAVVPSTLSVLCLVLAHRSRRPLVFAAGALAVGAALIKQSFLDAGFAGAVFVVASAVVGSGCAPPLAARLRGGRGHPARRAARLAGGGAQSVGDFVYTLFGFRLELLHTLAGSDIPLHVRLRSSRSRPGTRA